MILTSPNSILFDFGAIKIYYYGLIMAISIIIGILVCKFVCKKIYSDVNFDFVYNLATGAIISGLIGARLYYVIAANKYFSKHLTEIFAIQNGGMSIHGAILGGLIFSIIYLNMKKLHVLKYLDILSFGIISWGTNWVKGYQEIAIFAFILVGALIGFLMFNGHPAKVFMGDIGSLSLGATLASIAIITKHEVTFIVVMALFIFETLVCLIQIVSMVYFHRKVETGFGKQ